MTVIRWRPIGDLNSIQRELNRMFDSVMREENIEEEYRGSWSPLVDVKELSDAILITAELPGLKKEEIKVTVRENMLHISGEKKKDEDQKDTNYHRTERFYGKFSRTFTLPTLVESGKILAVFKDGVLNLTLPKAEKVKPKEIQIVTE